MMLIITVSWGRPKNMFTRLKKAFDTMNHNGLDAGATMLAFPKRSRPSNTNQVGARPTNHNYASSTQTPYKICNTINRHYRATCGRWMQQIIFS